MDRNRFNSRSVLNSWQTSPKGSIFYSQPDTDCPGIATALPLRAIANRHPASAAKTPLKMNKCMLTHIETWTQQIYQNICKENMVLTKRQIAKHILNYPSPGRDTENRDMSPTTGLNNSFRSRCESKFGSTKRAMPG